MPESRNISFRNCVLAAGHKEIPMEKCHGISFLNLFCE